MNEDNEDIVIRLRSLFDYVDAELGGINSMIISDACAEIESLRARLLEIRERWVING
jgi:hypothetical protein